jgi:hypothetical protein
MILHVLHGEHSLHARLDSHQLKIAFQFKLMYEVLNSATAFFMFFMLFMVKHILGSGRRPGCEIRV